MCICYLKDFCCRRDSKCHLHIKTWILSLYPETTVRATLQMSLLQAPFSASSQKEVVPHCDLASSVFQWSFENSFFFTPFYSRQLILAPDSSDQSEFKELINMSCFTVTKTLHKAWFALGCVEEFHQQLRLIPVEKVNCSISGSLLQYHR